MKIKKNNKFKDKFSLFAGIFLIVSGMILSGPSIKTFSIFNGNSPLPSILSIALILIGVFELFYFFRKFESK